MNCKKGHKMIYTLWNTEKGDDEGWYCEICDTYITNYEKRRNN